MDALLSMLVDLSRTFLQDVADITELSHINEKFANTLAAIVADSSQAGALNALLHHYYSEIMTLYSRYPQSMYLDTLLHRIESLLQIANTLNGKL